MNLLTKTIALLAMVSSSLTAESPIRPGDRIAIVGNTFADQLRIHGYLETALLLRTKGNPVSIRNLAWAGDTLDVRQRPTNFPTEAATLTAHRTDAIIACFGMGDSFAGEKGLPGFRKNLEAFIASHRRKKYNGRSEVRLILVSPIACENLGRLTPNWSQRNNELAAYSRAMKEVADDQQIPFIDLLKPSSELMKIGSGPNLTTNGIHLNAYGYWLMSRVMADALLPGPQSWRIVVDAQSKKASARGAKVTTAKTGHELRFTVQVENPPSPAPPAKGLNHGKLDANLNHLVVQNLAPGHYLLTVDGKTIAAANHEQWAKGVVIDSTPAHKAAEAYRQAVNDKNLQFTYSWKALNQVHIVGERKRSASGRSLPAEIIEFNKLADQKDEALRDGIPLETHEWRLVRKSGKGQN